MLYRGPFRPFGKVDADLFARQVMAGHLPNELRMRHAEIYGGDANHGHGHDHGHGLCLFVYLCHGRGRGLFRAVYLFPYLCLVGVLCYENVIVIVIGTGASVVTLSTSRKTA